VLAAPVLGVEKPPWKTTGPPVTQRRTQGTHGEGDGLTPDPLPFAEGWGGAAMVATCMLGPDVTFEDAKFSSMVATGTTGPSRWLLAEGDASPELRLCESAVGDAVGDSAPFGSGSQAAMLSEDTFGAMLVVFDLRRIGSLCESAAGDAVGDSAPIGSELRAVRLSEDTCRAVVVSLALGVGPVCPSASFVVGGGLKILRSRSPSSLALAGSAGGANSDSAERDGTELPLCTVFCCSSCSLFSCADFACERHNFTEADSD